MPNTREKLIELLKESKLCSKRFDDQYSDGTIAIISDHLIANGVTFATDNNVGDKWISVKDRLPEEWKTVLVFKPSIDAIIPAKLRGGSWYAAWDTTRLEYVSHWMPLPMPPKEE